MRYIDILVSLLWVTTLIGIVLAWWAWRRRPRQGAVPFTWLMLGAAEWSLAYALELGSALLPAKIFWAKMQYLGIVAIPGAWILFAISYLGVEKWLIRYPRRWILLLAEPLITLLLVWTNEYHGLVWAHTALEPDLPFPLLAIDSGWWYWVNVVYSYLALAFGTWLLLRSIRSTSPLYRQQTISLSLVILLPWIGNVLYMFDLTPISYLDLTPLTFVLAGLAVSWAFFRNRLLALDPIVSSMALEQMHDGVILIDEQGCIVDLNPSARQILSPLSTQMIGASIANLLPGWPGFPDQRYGPAETRADVVLAPAPTFASPHTHQRHYNLRISSLSSRRGGAGYLVMITDITDRIGAEKNLRDTQSELEQRVQERTSQLVQLNAQLQQEVAQRQQAEEATLRRAESLRAVSEMAIRCADAGPDTDIYQLVAQELQSITNALAASISSYDSTTQSLVLRHIAASTPVLQQVSKILGHSLIGMPLPVNDETMERMIGKTILITDDLSEISFGAIPQPIAAAIQRLLHTGTFVGLALNHGGRLMGSAAVYLIQGQEAPSPDLAQTLAHVIAVSLRRKEVEDALRQSEERFRHIFEFAPVGIYQTTPQGQILLANPTLVQMLGYTSAEDLRQRNLEVEGYQEGHSRSEFKRQVESTGQITGSVSAWVTRDRNTLYVRENARTIVDDQGRIAYYEGTVEDITERVRAERLLKALNAAALAMARAMTPEEIFDAADRELAQLNCSCLVMQLSDDEQQLYVRYTSQTSTIPQALQQLFNAVQRTAPLFVQNIPMYRQVIQDRQTVYIPDAGMICRAFPSFLQEAIAEAARALDDIKLLNAPLIASGRTIGLFSVQSPDLVPDDAPAITAFAHQMAAAWEKAQLMQDLQQSLQELQRTQAQLIQAQKMEAVGRLAGGIAHDFNNLLTAITGYTNMVLEETAPGSAVRADLEQVQSAVDRAVGLTRQLLAFSRKQVLQPKVLNLNELVRNVDKMLQRLIGEDIELHTILDSNPSTILADPQQIEQVIINLAINARDAMPDGGRLSIQTGSIVIDETHTVEHVDLHSGPYVTLTVRDTGHGITAETLTHLFEPFFTTKEVGKGTGLGLATVHGIVKQSGGDIAVHSEPGVGTVFDIYLPQIQAVVESKTEPEMPSMPRGKETILLCEDDNGVRELARRALERQGYTMLLAARPQEALDLCVKYHGQIELLITDIVMPQMNGPELSRQVIATRPSIKVLYISGYTDDPAMRLDISNTQAILLQKPFTPSALARQVREILDQ